MSTSVIFLKFSWLGLFNRLIFQWLFIRLTKCQENKVEEYSLRSYSTMIDGSVTSMGTGIVKTYQWYSFMFWVVPLTGWSRNFIWLHDECQYLKLTKARCIS